MKYMEISKEHKIEILVGRKVQRAVCISNPHVTYPPVNILLGKQSVEFGNK